MCAASAARLHPRAAITARRGRLFRAPPPHTPNVLLGFFPTAFPCGLVTSISLLCLPPQALLPSPPFSSPAVVPLTFSQESRRRLSQLQPLLTIPPPPSQREQWHSEKKKNPDKEGAVVEQQANTGPPCRGLIFPV